MPLCLMFGRLVASSAKLQKCQAQVSMAYSHLATAAASATGSPGMHFYHFVMDPQIWILESSTATLAKHWAGIKILGNPLKQGR